MNKQRKTLILLALFAILLGAAYFAYIALGEKISPEDDLLIEQNEGEVSGSNGTSPEEKIKAPDFTVTDVEGNKVKLSDMLGKPIVLNFWASWCNPCKGEMPEFNEVYEEVGETVTFMMVNLVDGQRETKETGAQYIQEQGFSFPVYFDMEQEAANAYGIMSIPTTIFIDKDGYIVTGAQGVINKETLLKGIDMTK